MFFCVGDTLNNLSLKTPISDPNDTAYSRVILLAHLEAPPRRSAC
jgi:hypothetical protein